MQKFVMHRKFWETSILKLDDFVFVLNIVYNSFVISADNIRYNCELDSQSGNTWTATILRDGATRPATLHPGHTDDTAATRRL